MVLVSETEVGNSHVDPTLHLVPRPLPDFSWQVCEIKSGEPLWPGLRRLCLLYTYIYNPLPRKHIRMLLISLFYSDVA